MIATHYIRKRLLLLSILLCSSLSIFADFIEDFSDGNYTDNPTWTGTYENFAINAYGQLQTKAQASATSYLSTPSTVNSEAEWTFFCRIATTPTAYNYMRFYLISSTENPLDGNGWFVQIGGANKNITLCQQIDGEKETHIDNSSRKKLLDNPENKLHIRVRLQNGIFSLESKIIGTDSDFVLEGTYTPRQIGQSNYFSILVKNTSETGNRYYADDISVRGETKEEDTINPDQPNADRYAEADDVVINEIMFDPAIGGQEYIELYNRTEENLALSTLAFTTLDSEGEYMKFNLFPTQSTIPAQGYAVLCADADSLRKAYNCPISSVIYSTKWTKKFPNTGTTLCLVYQSPTDTFTIDSVSYSPSWHHPLLEDTRGVSLERIHPDLPSDDPTSWQSASKQANHATPGTINSQYQDIYTENEEKKQVYTTQDYFSPNGDGIDDICLIHYELPTAGFVANIRILTANGLLINTLTQNELLSTEGVIPWDGTTARGHVTEIGVYVLICEFTHTTTGQIIRVKLPIVVSA